MPERDAIADLKPLQLKAATEVGLRVPETLITNDPQSARTFVCRHPQGCIYKRLSGAPLLDEAGRLTAAITVEITPPIAERLQSVAVTPCLFQPRIDKAYELRVTVVDEQVFAARVNSQSDPRTRIDSRLSRTIPWTPYDLPPEVARGLRRLTRRLGLVFAAIDLIVTPAGEYVFLELNPAGQWAWFPPEITYPIRDAIARTLVAGRTARVGKTAAAPLD